MDYGTSNNRLMNVLLVEDDPCDAMLTKKVLRDAEFFDSFHVAKDGLEAIEFLRGEAEQADTFRPDLILLDLNMPRMDGREFLQTVKSDENLRRIPVIVLTTSDAERDVMQCYDLHASCYLTKPVSLDEFAALANAIKGFWMSMVKYAPV